MVKVVGAPNNQPSVPASPQRPDAIASSSTPASFELGQNQVSSGRASQSPRSQAGTPADRAAELIGLAEASDAEAKKLDEEILILEGTAKMWADRCIECNVANNGPSPTLAQPDDDPILKMNLCVNQIALRCVKFISLRDEARTYRAKALKLNSNINHSDTLMPRSWSLSTINLEQFGEVHTRFAKEPAKALEEKANICIDYAIRMQKIFNDTEAEFFEWRKKVTEASVEKSPDASSSASASGSVPSPADKEIALAQKVASVREALIDQLTAKHVNGLMAREFRAQAAAVCGDISSSQLLVAQATRVDTTPSSYFNPDEASSSQVHHVFELGADGTTTERSVFQTPLDARATSRITDPPQDYFLETIIPVPSTARSSRHAASEAGPSSVTSPRASTLPSDAANVPDESQPMFTPSHSMQAPVGPAVSATSSSRVPARTQRRTVMQRFASRISNAVLALRSLGPNRRASNTPISPMGPSASPQVTTVILQRAGSQSANPPGRVGVLPQTGVTDAAGPSRVARRSFRFNPQPSQQALAALLAQAPSPPQGPINRPAELRGSATDSPTTDSAGPHRSAVPAR